MDKLDLVLQLATGRFRGRFEHIPFDVVLPAVIDASQAAFFVAAVKQRSPSMRAVLVQEADPPPSIAKRDQVLAEQTHSDGRTIGFGTSSASRAGIQ